MPSLGSIATFFGLALLAVSNAQDTTQRQSNPNVSEVDKTLLLAAVNDVDAYSSDVSTLVCVYTVDKLETKKNDYSFGITGCKVDAEFVGRCPDLTSFPGCGSYNVVVSSKAKGKKPKVKSITKASK
ncbi:hypothetical protein PHPALM_19755 [Phytophthora palmivora]|uniref:Uncharacterized protein n=1 Tax=Phytophthora palmivora TaxID=4796 RepID=A0A2P4XGK4_9STRA|nr:hypothetical protein PHPALM_19755 [Phytophthora palmivora]